MVPKYYNWRQVTMSPSGHLKGNRQNYRLAVANIALVASAFIWYLIAFSSLKTALFNAGASNYSTLVILGSNTGAIALAGLIGTFVVGKYVERARFLYVWVTSGIALSLIPLIVNTTNLDHILVLSLIFGAYFGLGMPATMAYFSKLTKVGDRAKTSGFTFLIIGITFALTTVFSQSSLFAIALVLTAIRVIGLVALHTVEAVDSTPSQTEKESKAKYLNILSNKSFALYFVPWLMFTLINYMTIPIQSVIYPNEAAYAFLAEIENIVMAIVAVIIGFFADKIGRKRITIVGFIMLGIGYAVVGLFSANVEALPVTSVFFMLADGIAWGIFYVLFIFTIWGDLAQKQNSDKFYFLGVLPYVSAYFMQLIFTPYLSEIGIATIFSFASVFLFLAVLPLIYAPETLPEKLLKDRELKSYVESARKKADKEAEKTRRKQDPEPKPEKKPEDSEDNYEEARKLAEKYY